MNKALIATSMAALLASSLLAQNAQAQDSYSSQGGADYSNPLNDFFVDGNLGQTQYRNQASHNNSAFQNVRLGWRWDGIVGPEIGYVYLGRPKNEIRNDFIQRSSSVENRAATIGANVKYNFYQNWFLTAHAGYMRAQNKEKVNFYRLNTTVRQKNWNNGLYAGAGLGYDITSRVSLSLNYDDYRLDQDSEFGYFHGRVNVAAYSAGVEVRF